MDAAAINKKRRMHFTAGLWLLIGPTALLIVGFLAYAIINWVSGAVASPTDSSTLFGAESTGASIANIIMFLISLVAMLTWLPGLIIGIVLLATMPPKPTKQG